MQKVETRGIVLAGGFGTRMREVLDRQAVPCKALLRFDGMPVLQILLRELGKAGIGNSLVCVDHRSAETAVRSLVGDQEGIRVVRTPSGPTVQSLGFVSGSQADRWVFLYGHAPIDHRALTRMMNADKSELVVSGYEASTRQIPLLIPRSGGVGKSVRKATKARPFEVFIEPPFLLPAAFIESYKATVASSPSTSLLDALHQWSRPIAVFHSGAPPEANTSQEWAAWGSYLRGFD